MREISFSLARICGEPGCGDWAPWTGDVVKVCVVKSPRASDGMTAGPLDGWLQWPVTAGPGGTGLRVVWAFALALVANWHLELSNSWA